MAEEEVTRNVTCPNCKVVVAKHTNTVLTIGPVHFIQKEVFYCNACSARIRWRPLPQAEVPSPALTSL